MDTECSNKLGFEDGFWNQLGEAGPFQLTRALLAAAKRVKSNSVSYHFAYRFESLVARQPMTFFSAGRALSRHNLAPEFVEPIGRCHDFVLQKGRPCALAPMIPAFQKVQPELTKLIMASINEYGVTDEYLIPVFGPFGINAVISFGFNRPVTEVPKSDLSSLEALSSIVHNRIVVLYRRFADEIKLSKREADVLHWISRGKTRSEIASILAIKPSSVDTYTRRIFKKLDVNDRASATLKGLAAGIIHHN